MNNRQRMLGVLEYLKENTNANHGAFAPELIDYLNSLGVKGERKTIYADIADLNAMGYEIELSSTGYYYAGELFEPAELRILVDQVKGSHFLPDGKKGMMTTKLLQLTNRFDRPAIDAGGKIPGSSHNNRVLYVIQDLMTAIENHQSVDFRYVDETLDGIRKARRHDYRMFPYALVNRQDRYYLVGWHIAHHNPINLRVDKIEDVRLLADYYEKPEFEVDRFVSEAIDMYYQQPVSVFLRVSERLYEQVRRQFGSLIVTGKEDGWFTANVSVANAPTFYSWIFTFGNEITILGPETVREEYVRMCRQIIAAYGVEKAGK